MINANTPTAMAPPNVFAKLEDDGDTVGDVEEGAADDKDTGLLEGAAGCVVELESRVKDRVFLWMNVSIVANKK